MSEVLRIIDETFRCKMHETTFTGNVFFYKDNKLDIERNVLNRLVNKFNSALANEPDRYDWRLDLTSHLFLVFVLEVFEDNSERLTRLDRNYYLSTIIHENGIMSLWSEETEGYDKKPDVLNVFGWENMEFVELTEVGENLCFRFYYQHDTEQYDIYSNSFGTYDKKTFSIIGDLLTKIISNKNETVNNSVQLYDELKSRINNLIGEEKNYEKALEELEHFKDIYETEDVSDSDTSFYHLRKTSALICAENYGMALKTIDSFINKFIEINEIPPIAYELKGEILLKTKNVLPAVNCLALSEEGYALKAYKNDVVALLKEESYSKLKEVFLEVPFNQRKLIFIGENIYATQSNGMIVLKKNDLPLNLKFPVGHPHLNEVYTCHPHKQDFYLPLKSYNEELFYDRIHEFSWLLQCLGAATLEISSSKSEFSDKTVRSKSEVDAQIDYKLSGAKVNFQEENTENALIDGKMNIAKKQVFNPSKLPFVPDDLVWYPSNTSWQRLAHQRLHGGIMMHNELISSSQSETVSTHELKQVEAELKLLLPKLGVKYNSEKEVNISSLKKYELMVDVEFANINHLSQHEQQIKVEPAGILNSENENYSLLLEKYKEDVLFMLEDDGVIDESERNILNRKIKKYCITEEDARSIENELITSGYSENELNYIQELKDLLEDGEISDIERKILDRYAKKFSLTMDDQKKIDAIFII